MTAALATRPNASLAEQDFLAWADRGREIWERHKESQWELAVWWDTGERRWGEALQVAQDLGINPGYLHKAKYILQAARESEKFLPTGVVSTDLDFWKWQPLANQALEPDEKATLAEQAIKSRMTSRVLEATVREYLKAKSLPEREQPKFENGLAEGAKDDGLPLAPHGVTRVGSTAVPYAEDPRAPVMKQYGDDLHEEACDVFKGYLTDRRCTCGTDEALGTTDEPTEADQDEAAEAFWSMRLSPECRHQIDLLRRYYARPGQPELTAAQVIERAIGQLCQIKKDRLARFE